MINPFKFHFKHVSSYVQIGVGRSGWSVPKNVFTLRAITASGAEETRCNATNTTTATEGRKAAMRQSLHRNLK